MKPGSLVATCLSAVVTTVAVMHVQLAHAERYALIFEKSFHPGKATVPPKVSSLIKSADGGYLLIGGASEVQPWQPFAVKVNANGEEKWEWFGEDAGEFSVEYAGVGDNDGGVLVIGRNYIAKVDRGGHTVWRRGPPGQGRPAAGGNFACGVRVQGGFILVGENAAGVDSQGRKGYRQLLVRKLEDGGNTKWEFATFEDGEEFFSPGYLIPAACSSPIVDAKGGITFAVSVLDPRGLAFILALKLDANGKEIARLHLNDNGRQPRLFETPTGYVLIAGNVITPEGKPQLVRIVLDRNMKVLSQRDIEGIGDYQLQEVSAAWMDAKGGVHLAGHVLAPKRETLDGAIAYLNPKGVLVGLKRSVFGLLAQPVGLVQGAAPADVVLLVRGTQDMRLLKFRTSR